MICPKCNFQNQEGTQFCINCGSPLTVSAAPSAPVSMPASAPSSAPSFTDNMLVMSIIGFVCGGGLLGLLAFYLIWSKKTWNKAKKVKATFIYLAILYAVFFLVYTIVFGSIFGAIRNQRSNQASNQTQSQQVNQGFPTSSATLTSQPNNTALGKYDIDSNKDGIPDFVEVATGYDPKIDSCQKIIGCDANFTGSQAGQTNILFILDSSGSMAESISGGVKMDVARQALTSFVSTVPNNVNIGLMVYGHKGSNTLADKAVSCKGIDLLYPLGTINESQFVQAINSFEPTGWTPIGDALRMAKNVAFVGKDGQKNSIVLITDGIETCDSNPLGAVSELKASGITAVINVIGLAVDQTSASQLKQIADASGGIYVTANNIDDLKNAINSAHENLKNYTNADECISQNWYRYQDCFNNKFNKAVEYLQNMRNNLNCLSSLNNPNNDECKKNLDTELKMRDVHVALDSQSWSGWKEKRDALMQQYQNSK